MSGLIVALWLFGIVIAILWILLPFAIFGMKDLIRELIVETRKTNQLLEQRQIQPPST